MKQVMKQAMTCPKCKAGKGALYSNRRFLECGVVVAEISCMLCGWANTQPVHAQAATNILRKDDNIYQVRERKPCSLVGCERSYSPINNKHRLCSRCAQRMRQWWGSRRRNPAPLLQQGKVWIDNPEFTGAKS